MAKLGSMKLNTVSDGEWVQVNETGEPFEVKVRGYGNKYRDYYNGLLRDARRRANRQSLPGAEAYDIGDLPPSVVDECQAKAINEHVLIDVRGLEHDDGRVVAVDELKEMLLDPAWKLLVGLISQAALHVTIATKTEVEQAEGNSKPVSAGI